MKNFIFKSSDFGLIKNVSNKLDIILAELRHQRNDHVTLQHDLEKLRLDLNLRRQADDYYVEHNGEAHPGEPSPQTDYDEQNGEKQ